MKTCGRCERARVVDISLDDSMDVCGHTFTAQLPAEKCAACGQIVILGTDMKRFELRIAVELAKAGLRSGEAFGFLRKSLGLDESGLGELLDVPPEFVQYWERGDWPMDPRAHGVLCALVLARHEGRPAVLDSLRILREPRSLARKVRVHLTDALAQAAKALQFGSAARTAPALA